jgi:hypothetical protein
MDISPPCALAGEIDEAMTVVKIRQEDTAARDARNPACNHENFNIFPTRPSASSTIARLARALRSK